MKQKQQESFLCVFVRPCATDFSGRVGGDVGRRIKRYLLDPVGTQTATNLQRLTEIRLTTDIKHRKGRWI